MTAEPAMSRLRPAARVALATCSQNRAMKSLSSGLQSTQQRTGTCSTFAPGRQSLCQRH